MMSNSKECESCIKFKKEWGKWLLCLRASSVTTVIAATMKTASVPRR